MKNMPIFVHDNKNLFRILGLKYVLLLSRKPELQTIEFKSPTMLQPKVQTTLLTLQFNDDRLAPAH